MKKIILLFLLIPLVSLGQNEDVKKNKRKKTNDINLSKNELQEPYNPFLDLYFFISLLLISLNKTSSL